MLMMMTNKNQFENRVIKGATRLVRLLGGIQSSQIKSIFLTTASDLFNFFCRPQRVFSRSANWQQFAPRLLSECHIAYPGLIVGHKLPFHHLGISPKTHSTDISVRSCSDQLFGVLRRVRLQWPWRQYFWQRFQNTGS